MAENQRIRLSKKMLKESLTGLLHEKNIHKISVREICDNAQVNRTTFYKYYGSQYDLLEGMESELLSKIDEYLGRPSNETDMDRLKKVLTYALNNLDLCRLLFNNNIDPEFPGRLISLPRIQEKLSQLLADGYDGEELQYISSFIVNGGYSIIKEWINKEKPEPPEIIASLLAGTIFKLYPVSMHEKQ